jgi:hypothetical protein
MLPNKAALSTRPPPEGSPAVCQAIYADRAAGTVRSPLDAAVGVLPMPGRRLDSIASGSWRESRLDRMSRDEFFAKVAPLDEERLRKALWNLYWRGTAATRERIEAELTPEVGLPRQKAAEPADPARVREEAEDFVALARAGVYIAGSRRVSPKERSRWRFTFKRLLAEARDTLRATDLDPGVAAMTALIDLACEMRDREYFRSNDPIEAAKVVVSDEVSLLWKRVREHRGFAEIPDASSGRNLGVAA